MDSSDTYFNHMLVFHHHLLVYRDQKCAEQRRGNRKESQVKALSNKSFHPTTVKKKKRFLVYCVIPLSVSSLRFIYVDIRIKIVSKDSTKQDLKNNVCIVLFILYSLQLIDRPVKFIGSIKKKP